MLVAVFETQTYQSAWAWGFSRLASLRLRLLQRSWQAFSGAALKLLQIISLWVDCKLLPTFSPSLLDPSSSTALFSGSMKGVLPSVSFWFSFSDDRGEFTMNEASRYPRFPGRLRCPRFLHHQSPSARSHPAIKDEFTLIRVQTSSADSSLDDSSSSRVIACGAGLLSLRLREWIFFPRNETAPACSFIAVEKRPWRFGLFVGLRRVGRAAERVEEQCYRTPTEQGEKMPYWSCKRHFVSRIRNFDYFICARFRILGLAKYSLRTNDIQKCCRGDFHDSVRGPWKVGWGSKVTGKYI